MTPIAKIVLVFDHSLLRRCSAFALLPPLQCSTQGK